MQPHGDIEHREEAEQCDCQYDRTGTIGAKISASNARPRLRRISTPSASKVPSKVAMAVETSATTSVLSAADYPTGSSDDSCVPW